MTNGAGDLPAYPVRVACEFMTDTAPAAAATPIATTPESARHSDSSSSSSSGRSDSRSSSSSSKEEEEEDLWLMSGECFGLLDTVAEQASGVRL